MRRVFQEAADEAQRRKALSMAMERMNVIDEPTALSCQEIAEEIRIMRAERKRA
jgi:hypothetical protein